MAARHAASRWYIYRHVMDIQLDLYYHPTFVHGHLIEVL
jgi:hypothetical protein